MDDPKVSYNCYIGYVFYDERDSKSLEELVFVAIAHKANKLLFLESCSTGNRLPQSHPQLKCDPGSRIESVYHNLHLNLGRFHKMCNDPVRHFPFQFRNP